MAGTLTVAMEQALRRRMRSILLSDAAQGLDFYVDHIHVDGSALSYVALALVDSPDRNRGVSIQIGGMDAGADAAYDPTSSTFKFPNPNYGETSTPDWRRLFERMAIVHECIHAWRHSLGTWMPTADGTWPTWGVSSEAAAFIGGALFFLEDQGPISASDTAPPWASDRNPCYADALGMALNIRMSSKKGCNVNDLLPANLQGFKKGIRSFYDSHKLHLATMNEYTKVQHM